MQFSDVINLAEPVFCQKLKLKKYTAIRNKKVSFYFLTKKKSTTICIYRWHIRTPIVMRLKRIKLGDGPNLLKTKRKPQFAYELL